MKKPKNSNIESEKAQQFANGQQNMFRRQSTQKDRVLNRNATEVQREQQIIQRIVSPKNAVLNEINKSLNLGGQFTQKENDSDLLNCAPNDSHSNQSDSHLKTNKPSSPSKKVFYGQITLIGKPKQRNDKRQTQTQHEFPDRDTSSKQNQNPNANISNKRNSSAQNSISPAIKAKNSLNNTVSFKKFTESYNQQIKVLQQKKEKINQLTNHRQHNTLLNSRQSSIKDLDVGKASKMSQPLTRGNANGNRVQGSQSTVEGNKNLNRENRGNEVGLVKQKSKSQFGCGSYGRSGNHHKANDSNVDIAPFRSAAVSPNGFMERSRPQSTDKKFFKTLNHCEVKQQLIKTKNKSLNSDQENTVAKEIQILTQKIRSANEKFKLEDLLLKTTKGDSNAICKHFDCKELQNLCQQLHSVFQHLRNEPERQSKVKRKIQLSVQGRRSCSSREVGNSTQKSQESGSSVRKANAQLKKVKIVPKGKSFQHLTIDQLENSFSNKQKIYQQTRLMSRVDQIQTVIKNSTISSSAFLTSKNSFNNSFENSHSQKINSQSQKLNQCGLSAIGHQETTLNRSVETSMFEDPLHFLDLRGEYLSGSEQLFKDDGSEYFDHQNERIKDETDQAIIPSGAISLDNERPSTVENQCKTADLKQTQAFRQQTIRKKKISLDSNYSMKSLHGGGDKAYHKSSPYQHVSRISSIEKRVSKLLNSSSTANHGNCSRFR